MYIKHALLSNLRLDLTLHLLEIIDNADSCYLSSMHVSDLSFIGDNAVFKAKVTGKPQPSVKWERASGNPLSDATNIFYDNINNQHILKVGHENYTAHSVPLCKETQDN